MTAERVGQVPLRECYVDCNPVGNPFCIVFWPDIPYVFPGWQFEVHVSGLCGKTPELHLFTAFRTVFVDDLRHLVASARKFKEHVGCAASWGEPVLGCPELPAASRRARVVPSGDMQAAEAERKRQQNARRQGSRHKWKKRGAKADKEFTGHLSKKDAVPTKTEDVLRAAEAMGLAPSQRDTRKTKDQGVRIGLVSHPHLRFSAESNYLVIALEAPGAVMLTASLVSRPSAYSTVPLPRCTLVQRFGSRFLVRVILPFTGNYEISVSLTADHRVDASCVVHPLMYEVTAEWIRELLPSADHPMFKRFGYPLQLERGMAVGVSVVAPVTYCLPLGYVYFLVLVADGGKGWGKGAAARCMVPAKDLRKGKFPLFIRPDHEPVPGLGLDGDDSDSDAEEFGGRAPLTSRVGMRKVDTAVYGDQFFDVVGEMRSQFLHLAHEQVQQSFSFRGIRLEVSVAQGREIHRLLPRPDFPEMHECVIKLGQIDENGKVEMFARHDHLEELPHCVGEWIVSGSSVG